MFAKSFAKLFIQYAVDTTNLIVSFRKGDSWEQITGDAIEQRNIMRQKLGFIYILYGAQELNKTIFGQSETFKSHV